MLNKEWPMTKIYLSIVILSISFCTCVTPTEDPQPYVSPGTLYAITTATTSLTDTTRGWHDGPQTPANYVATRDIPLKVYSPAASQPGPFPLVMVSHGLGGNGDITIAYMAETLAEHGYVVVAVQHHRSDADYLNAHGSVALLAAASEEETRLLRPGDITFILDRIEAGATGIALLDPARLDLTRIGMAGHSFGAWTTLSCLGQTFDGGTDMADPRIDCGVAYSPQGPGTLGLAVGSWDGLTKPTFTMHGTEDTAPGTNDPEERHIPFDSMPATGTKYHATLDGAQHEDFGNIQDGFYHDWIEQMTMAFFDANLKDESPALDWLNAGTIEDLTGYVHLEWK